MRRSLLYIAIFILVLSLVGCKRKPAAIQSNDPPEKLISESVSGNLPTETKNEDLSGGGAESAATTFVSIHDVVPQYDTTSSEMFFISDNQHDDAQCKTSYVHLPNMGHFEYANDVFTVCTDEVYMNQGNHYAAYVIENGQFEELGRETFSKEYDLFGNTYRVEFEYAVYDGQILITYSPACNETNHVHGAVEFLENNSCLVGFAEQASSGETMYHLMILDLSNGELTDLYSSLSPELQKKLRCSQVDNIAFISDNRFVIEQVDGSFYYVDTVDNVACNLDSLVGVEIKQCSVVGENVVCWNADGDYWEINVADLSTRLLLNDKKDSYASGIWYENGCSFTVYKSEGKFHVFDFVKKTDRIITPPDGWELRTETFHASPDGRRFYTIKREDNGPIQLLAFDCDLMKFVEICRTNLNTVDETMGGWTADGKIFIQSQNGTDIYIYDVK